MQVHWHEGLFLQPHHLQVMQRGLLQEMRSARGLLIPYPYGILESSLSIDDLADGRLRFNRLRAIMPSGQEVVFPDEASLPPLDIKQDLVRPGGLLEYRLAVPLWSSNRGNAFKAGIAPDPRVKLLFVPEEVPEVRDENQGENPQPLIRRKVNARIVPSEADLADMEWIPLLRVKRGTGQDAGRAQPDADYAPPCIVLSASHGMMELVQDLAAQVNASREAFRAKILAGGLGTELKSELVAKLKTLNRFSVRLPALIGLRHVSPFSIYLELRELLAEFLALFPDKDEFHCLDYNHDDALPCFLELNRKIRPLIQVTKAAEPLKAPFAGEAGRMRTQLDEVHLIKPSAYYLGIRTAVERTRLSLHVTDGNKFKFMPRSLEDAAILGVELKEENYPPDELPRGQYYYQVKRDNQRRWDQICKDKAASLVWNNAEFDLADAKFTLYMTLPGGGPT